LPGFRVYLDSGRVLEKKPVNQMECGVHYISTRPTDKAGEASTEKSLGSKGRSVTIKNKQEL